MRGNYLTDKFDRFAWKTGWLWKMANISYFGEIILPSKMSTIGHFSIHNIRNNAYF